MKLRDAEDDIKQQTPLINDDRYRKRKQNIYKYCANAMA